MKSEPNSDCSNPPTEGGQAGFTPTPESNLASVAHGWFETTHWSILLEAAKEDSARRLAALETLCQTYWQPVYAFVRRGGYEIHDAQDLTQSFFAQLLERDCLRNVDPKKGKFRSFRWPKPPLPWVSPRRR